MPHFTICFEVPAFGVKYIHNTVHNMAVKPPFNGDTQENLLIDREAPRLHYNFSAITKNHIFQICNKKVVNLKRKTKTIKQNLEVYVESYGIKPKYQTITENELNSVHYRYGINILRILRSIKKVRNNFLRGIKPIDKIDVKTQCI